jgi:hypothetical protein
VNDAFDRDRRGFAAADAQRRDATLQAMGLQRMKQRYDQPRTGGADRMAECAGAAMRAKVDRDDSAMRQFLTIAFHRILSRPCGD